MTTTPKRGAPKRSESKPPQKALSLKIPMPLWKELRDLVTEGRYNTLTSAIVAGAWLLVDREDESA